METGGLDKRGDGIMLRVDVIIGKDVIAMFEKAVSILCAGALAGFGCLALSGCQSQPPRDGDVPSSSDNGEANTEIVLTPSGDQSILKISYQCGLAEVGGGRSYELTCIEGGDDVLYVAQLGASGSKYDVRQIPCADSVLDKVEEICAVRGVYGWSEALPENPVQHADRAEKLVFIEYLDGQKRTFSTQDALPAGGEEAIGEIGSVLEGAGGTG